MARAHIGFEQEDILVGLGGAQLGGPFGGLPIGHARIVQTTGDKQRRVSLRLHIVIGGIAADQLKRRLVGDRVAPFRPFAGRQRQGFILHRVEHIDERYMCRNRTPQLGVGVDDDTHQLATGRAARGHDAAGLGKAEVDQALG